MFLDQRVLDLHPPLTWILHVLRTSTVRAIYLLFCQVTQSSESQSRQLVYIHLKRISKRERKSYQMGHFVSPVGPLSCNSDTTIFYNNASTPCCLQSSKWNVLLFTFHLHKKIDLLFDVLLTGHKHTINPMKTPLSWLDWNFLNSTSFKPVVQLNTRRGEHTN